MSPTTHFHLVGNGQFVAEFQKGLLDGGVAEERVTTEKYFNGKATPDADVSRAQDPGLSRGTHMSMHMTRSHACVVVVVVVHSRVLPEGRE